jgi:hypothetical protein
VIVALWVALLVLTAMTVFLALVVSGLVQAMNELRMVEARFSSVRPKGLPVGATAPPITGTTPDGAPFDPGTLRGTAHVVAFVSPDCAPCEPLLRDLADRSRAIDLPRTVVVSSRPPDGHPTLVDLLDRDGVIVLTEPDDQLADRFQTHATPHVFVVDEGGVIRAQGVANSVAAIRSMLGREASIS